MKNARQTAILSIIERENIETQEELASKLREMGIVVTQATVSRDIKELRLLKVLSASGSYKYATADKAEHGVSEKEILRMMNELLSPEKALPEGESPVNSPRLDAILEAARYRAGHATVAQLLQFHSL